MNDLHGAGGGGQFSNTGKKKPVERLPGKIVLQTEKQRGRGLWTLPAGCHQRALAAQFLRGNEPLRPLPLQKAVLASSKHGVQGGELKMPPGIPSTPPESTGPSDSACPPLPSPPSAAPVLLSQNPWSAITFTPTKIYLRKQVGVRGEAQGRIWVNGMSLWSGVISGLVAKPSLCAPTPAASEISAWPRSGGIGSGEAIWAGSWGRWVHPAAWISLPTSGSLGGPGDSPCDGSPAPLPEAGGPAWSHMGGLERSPQGQARAETRGLTPQAP